MRSLVGSTYCSTRPSTPRQQRAGPSLLAASETCDASQRASPASPSATSRDPSLVTSTPDAVASYADERRAEKKDEPRARADDPTNPATAANQVIAPIPEIWNVALRALALCRVET